MRSLLRSAIVSMALASPMLIPATASAFVSIDISVGNPPPPLPVYEQPLIPGDGYIWTPGYWAWDGSDYYWVPGTWVLAPQPGFLWTPAWWGWDGGFYRFHSGYWGPHVGFYGGINYGFGYGGNGYEGGRWDGGHFFYNRSVNNINVTSIHNTYNTTVVNNVTVNHTSFNGGNGGVEARPTAQDEMAAHDHHIEATQAQQSHVEAARNNPAMAMHANGGHPAIAATPRPGAFNEHAAAAAHAGGGGPGAGSPGGHMASSGYAPHGNAGGAAQAHPSQPGGGNHFQGSPQAQPQQHQAMQQQRPAAAPQPQPRAQPQPRPQMQQPPRQMPQRPAPRPAPQPHEGGEHHEGR